MFSDMERRKWNLIKFIDRFTFNIKWIFKVNIFSKDRDWVSPIVDFINHLYFIKKKRYLILVIFFTKDIHSDYI